MRRVSRWRMPGTLIGTLRTGDECRAFGAAAIMRSPTRLHIAWEADDTLRFEFDHGEQARMVYFDRSMPPGERSWQGHAIGEWIDTTVPTGTYNEPGIPDVAPEAGAPRRAPCGSLPVISCTSITAKTVHRSVRTRW